MRRRSKFTLLLVALLLVTACGPKEEAKRPLRVDLLPGTTPSILYTYGATAVQIDTLTERYRARYDRDTLDFFLLTDTLGRMEAVLLPDTTRLRYRPGEVTGVRYGDELMEWQRLVTLTGDTLTEELSDFYRRMEGRRLSLFYAIDAQRRGWDRESSLPGRLFGTARYRQSDLFEAMGLSRDDYRSPRFPESFGPDQQPTKEFIKPDRFMAVLALTGEELEDSVAFTPFYHLTDSLGVKSLLLLVGRDEPPAFLLESDASTSYLSDSLGEATLLVNELQASRLPAYFVVDTLMRLVTQPDDLSQLTDYILDHDTIPRKKR